MLAQVTVKHFSYCSIHLFVQAVDTGFPPYLENLEHLEFCHLIFQAWNLLKEWEKLRILTQNLGKKTLNFEN